ncbi:DegT/DnrJ/EryC1/StrS family aminotransferase [Massilia cavernae]|nr:DegT/DnrJ/EryC1/StrS family aminotransferase [Massilia cavernae]
MKPTASTLEYQRFDPASCGFPRPFAPLLPAFRWSALSLGGGDAPDPALFEGPGVRHFSRGRYALHEAYRSAGVGPAGALLAPAYHCRTMMDPALALGGAVRFYDIGSDLTPDLDSIRALLAAPGVAARALVLPHYFGVEQPAALVDQLAALCAAHGMALVEDCSHAWQLAARRAPAARTQAGRAVVASPYKFFACEDGGVLWSAAVPSSPPASSGMLDELRALKRAWERSRLARQAGPPLPLPQAGRLEFGTVVAESGALPSPLYERACEQQASLGLSRWVMRRTRLTPLIRRRREHYQQWNAAVAGLRGARALFPELAPDCVPYMFPLEINMPNPSFFLLKQAGLPIWRWDDMAVSGSEVAARYRTHLLHLPCHQDLTREQMRWMTSLVAEVLA